MRRTSLQAKQAKDTVSESPQRSTRGLELITSLPRAPKALDKAAQAAWRQYGALAIELGVLTIFDIPALEVLARAASLCTQLEESVAKSGPIVNSRGALKANPALAALGRARAELLKYLAQFGLTPLGRESLSIERGKVKAEAPGKQAQADTEFMRRLRSRVGLPTETSN